MDARVVIVGAGLAGLRVAERLRRAGHTGALTLVGQERHRPYDRPPLSKGFLAGADPTWLRAGDRWDALDLDLRLGVRAHELDLAAGSVTVGADRIPFDRLVIATGVRARVVPAWSLPRVHTLRTLDDAREFRCALSAARRLVVIGAGVLGSEVAAAARRLGLHVDLVDPAPTPLVTALPAALGEVIAGLHRRHGVHLHLGRGVSSIGPDAVELDDGSRLNADVVLVAIGAVPNTEWLEGSGLAVDDGVLTDDTGTASDPRVLALGDVARRAETRRAEHWDNAASTAALVAANVLAEPEARSAARDVPYFWTDQFEVKFQLLGAVGPADVVTVVDGSPDSGRFLALHQDAQGALVGVCAAGDPAAFNRCRRALSEGWSTEDLLAAAPWALSGSAAAPRP